MTLPDAFIVLTGGAGRRLGGTDKAALTIDGLSLLDRALAVIGPRPTVVVGPHAGRPPDVTATRERPAGGGPAAAVAAGVAEMTVRLSDLPGPEIDEAAACGETADCAPAALVALWAIDQVGAGLDTWGRLAAAVRERARGQAATLGAGGTARADRGAVLASGGRRHYGIAVFPLAALVEACAAEPDWHGRSLRRLLDPVIVAEVEARGAEARDIDTLEDLRWWRARGLGDEAPLGAVDEGTSR